MFEQKRVAKELYEEGWRAGDVDQLMAQLNMNLLAAEDVAYYLQKIEDAEEEKEEEEEDP